MTQESVWILSAALAIACLILAMRLRRHIKPSGKGNEFFFWKLRGEDGGDGDAESQRDDAGDGDAGSYREDADDGGAGSWREDADDDGAGSWREDADDGDA